MNDGAGTGGTARQIAALERWREAENGTVAHTTTILSLTRNRFLVLLMEVLRQDAMLHYRLLGHMIDDLERPVGLGPEDVREVWGLLAHHLSAKRELAGLREELAGLGERRGHRQLLTCLYADQAKCAEVLGQLELLWRGAAVPA